MIKIFLTTLLLIVASTYASAKEDCKKLPGFKTINKDTPEYLECVKRNSVKSTGNKLNTESKVGDVLTGKQKIKIPNPWNGIKNLRKALKPDIKLSN